MDIVVNEPKYGKSYPNDRRRMNSNGEVLAPRHFRKMGRRLMSEVTDREIGQVYLGVDINRLDSDERGTAHIAIEAFRNKL